MSGQHLIAWSLADALSGGTGPLKILAVAGGAAVGGLGLGALTQLLVKGLTTQKMPPWPLNGTRLGGAILGGWLVALWAFGGGGTGVGGAGGWGFGSGGKGGAETAAKKRETEAAEKEKKDREKEAPNGTLRIEVLGDAVLKKIGESASDEKRRYRLAPGDAKLLTLGEVRTKLEALRAASKVPAVTIVLYRDSPSEGNTLWVKPLEDVANDVLGKSPKIELERAKYAPY